MKPPVFLDTVGLIAIFDKADPWHHAAVPVYTRLIRRRRTLITSLYVLLECGNTAAKKPYRESVTRLYNELDSLGLVIVPFPKEHEHAWLAYAARSNASAGIVDQYSFVVMRSLGIHEAFTNDRHFKAAGFITLF